MDYDIFAQNLINVGCSACLFYMYMHNRLTEKRLRFLELKMFDILKEKAGQKHDLYTETYKKDVGKKTLQD